MPLIVTCHHHHITWSRSVRVRPLCCSAPPETPPRSRHNFLNEPAGRNQPQTTAHDFSSQAPSARASTNSNHVPCAFFSRQELQALLQSTTKQPRTTWCVFKSPSAPGVAALALRQTHLPRTLVRPSFLRAVPLDLYIVGGYLGRSCAEEMSSRIISELHASARTFRVVLACMSRLNSARCEAVGGGSTTLPPPPPPPSPGRCITVTPLSGDSLGGGIGVAEGGSRGSSGGGGGSSGDNDTEFGLPNSGEADIAAERSCCPQARAASAGAVSDAHTAHADTQQPADADGRRGGDGWLPRRTGLAINLASGEPFPVRFEGAGRGPGWEVRYSRTFACNWKPLLSDVRLPAIYFGRFRDIYYIYLVCNIYV